MKYGLLVIGLFLFTGSLFGQSFKQEWNSIEASIQSKKNLQEVHDTVSSLRQQALRANNMAVAGRCFYYLMQIADQRTEDTLYFKNSRFTDSILDAPQSPPLLKAIMHLLQATRLINYQRLFFHRNNKNGISSYNARYDYSKLSEPELDTLISRHYQSALQLSLQLRNVPVEELLWLSGNPLSFLFKPDFSDIVYAECIRMFQLKAETNYASVNPDWLSFTQDRFMRLPDTLPVFTKKEQQVFRWYKQWMRHHQPEEPQAYYFIETLARKFFYNDISPDSAAMKRYEAYLQEITRSPYATVQAHAVLQLCLIWNNEAAAYNPSANEHDFYYKAKFDSTYRLRYRQALELFSRHEQLLDSFRYVKNILLSMKEKITMLGLTIRMFDTRLPNEPLPGWVQYRNVAQLYTRVVKINTAETLLVDRTRNLTRFLKLPAVEERIQSLQLPADYQWHNTFVKLPSLPAGRYILLYSDTAITDQTNRVNYQELSITNIAVLNNDDRLYVLNRKTGFPLQHASVMVKYNRKQTVHGTTNSVWKNVVLKVNGEGYVTVDRKDLHSVQVVYENDSVEAAISEPQTDIPEKLFSKEEYDDLMEYYEENIKLQLFTDRAIYRPGQTVYYKGIFTVRHPKTGKLLVLNWRNLKFPFYKKLFYKLLVKFSREKIELYVKDPFSREVDTLKVIPGRFGSFSGSFVLPKQAATGDWNIDMDDFEFTNENNGHFKVEEYRRPTFEISLEKPATELYLGDSFRVKAKIVSFAGAQLSNTKISYSVSRSGELPAAGASGHFRTGVYSTAELTTGQAYTDEKGEWFINVHDSLLKHYLFTEGRKWDMYYDIEVEAVDATGESHEAETRITLSTRPLTINIPVTAIVDRSVLVPLPISVKSDFAGQVKKQAEVKIYIITQHETGKQKALWPEADVWLYPVTDLQKTFPDIDFDHSNQLPEDKRLIYNTSVMAGKDKLVLPEALLQSGHYSIEVICRSNGKIIGEADKSFTVFDRQAGTLPSKTFSFHYMPFNLEEGGKPVTWITGNTEQDVYSVYHAAYYTKNGKRTAIQYSYENRFEKRGLHEWQYTIPSRAVDKVLLTHLYVLNNELYREEQTVVVNSNPAQPEIIVEQYRRQLVPGGKETFIVAVKTKSDHAAAELMTTMYDASLDKLEKHTWHLPRDDSYFPISNSWSDAISTQVNSTLYNQKMFLTGRPVSGVSVWWFDLETELSERYHHYQGITEFTRLAYGVLQGRAPGVDISGADFKEVVVVGYGTTPRRNASGAVVTIRGAASLSGYANMLIVLDGVPYEGDPSKINTGTIAEGLVLKGADATSLYGIRAAGGVLILSTKGPVQLPVPGQAPPPIIRKNFEETAFFYPQLHANRRGYYTFNFTLPESVTQWKWKMLAHTRKAGFAYAEKDLYSQLPLMVQPAVPRFLYQGDQIVLKTRITNLDSAAVSGVLACSIEDEVTGEDISRQLLVSSRQNFSVRQQATGSEAFTITIPENFLHPVRIKISGAAKNYSDGEEHVIPILAKKILATSTVPLLLYKDTTVSPPGLPDDAEPYGMGLYITPKPQAALVYSLPYLAFYPYGCAEQTLNKLLAHAVAVKLVRTDSVAQRLTHQDRPAQKTVARKEVPDQEEQTMPWLQLDHLVTVQQQKLARLLDTLESHKQMEKYFKELADMQTNDGGISWFKGGASSMYISAYVLSGLGKLQNDMLYLNKKTTETVLPGLLARLIYHCDTGFAGSPSGIQSTNYLYARVFWLKQYPLSPEAKVTFNTALENFWSKPDRYSLGRQAVMITTTLRFAEKSDRLYQAAMSQLESIRQSAIADSTYGTRWKSIADEEDLTTQTEEWLVKIAEAFETGGQSKETVAGIVTWLLRAKQAHGWSTTKSTAEAVSLLARQQSNILGNTTQLEVMIDGQTARVTNDLFGGSLYTFIKRPGRPFPVAGIRQHSPVLPALGELTYYYFTSKPPVVDPNSLQISISKALYRYNKTTKQWDTLQENSLLHIADRVKTVLTIATPRQLQYVFIEDKRAAALEPADASSGYRYEDGVNFYESVKDASMLFFADKIASGIHTISYEALVAQEGIFTNGPTLLQCMYQPGVKAYSTGRRIEIK